MPEVALINPAAPDSNFVPPLGLLILAAVLERQGHGVAVLDQNEDANIVDRIRDIRPDVIGITAVTSSVLNAKRLAARLKEESPQSVVVFGGPHPTSMPVETLSWPEVDFVVSGEAENAFGMLIEWIHAGGTPRQMSRIPNLHFKENGGARFTYQADFLSSQELDKLPLPAYHLLDVDRVSSRIRHGLFRRGRRVLSYMATRGCPHRCTFCCRMMGGGIRAKRPETVLREIESLVEAYKLDEIYLEDDNLTALKSFAVAILDGIIERGLPISIKLANGVRVDTLDDVLLDKLRRAGGYSLSFGLESGSPEVLRLMKKKLDLEKTRAVISMAKSHGFLVGANMIIGYPGETEQNIWDSYDYFRSLRLDSVAVVNLIPFPGTAVRDVCVEHGYLTEEANSWDNYYFDIREPRILIATDLLSKEQLKEILKKIFFKLYTNPRRMFSVLRNMQLSDIVEGASIFAQRVLPDSWHCRGRRDEPIPGTGA